MDVFEAVAARRSVRGFSDRSVPRDLLERIFGAAQRAPSWCNIQPWRVWLTSGAATRRLVTALGNAARSGAPPRPEFPFPAEYPEPYGAHRRACAVALYRAMGIERHDMRGRWEAWMRNFDAFGAPHVAIVGVDHRFGVYAALDVGCWLQSVLLLATAEGVSACPQASLATFPETVRSVLPIPEDVAILFGIALGWEDPSVPANACRTERSALAENVTFVED